MKIPFIEYGTKENFRPSVFGKNSAKGTLFSFNEIFQQIICEQK
jgi:hypothetical protein